MPEMDDWKPIETAPKDGTRIRVKRDDIEETVEWFAALNDWLIERDPDGVHHELLSWQPTHWMPLDLAWERSMN
jgi:hypothetical protein